jgi:TonB family protein
MLALLSAVALAAAQPAPSPPSPPTPPGRARANLSSYFSADDYPAAAVRAGEEGTVGFHLDIGADGTVSGCTVTRSSGSAALDAATCAILTARVHYTSARDARGRATTGSDEGRVTWRLPDESVDPFAPPAIPPAVPARPEHGIYLYFGTGDYPPEAIRGRQHGTVLFDALIGANGRALACRVARSSGAPALDQRTCDVVIARVRFHPARDNRGVAVQGTYSSRVTWELPGR